LTYRKLLSWGLIAGLSFNDMRGMAPGLVLDLYIRRREYDYTLHGIQTG